MERSTFTADQARESLERSLRALRSERIDIWLLHEVGAQDLADDGLLRLLEDMVANGTIGSFGVGSEAARVETLLRLRPAYCQTLQYEWSVLDSKVPQTDAFRIHHRALTNNFRSLHTALISRPATCKRWSQAVGLDLAAAETLGSLMLRASLLMNPESIILFSSKRAKHVQSNVATAVNPALEIPAAILYELVLAEKNELLMAANALEQR